MKVGVELCPFRLAEVRARVRVRSGDCEIEFSDDWEVVAVRRAEVGVDVA